jgi:hypothetical protein
MSHFGTVVLSIAVFSSQAFACISFPPRPFSVSGSSFSGQGGVDLRIGDGIYGAAFKTDESQISYHAGSKKWCILEDEKAPDKVQCVEPKVNNGFNVTLKNKKGEPKGILQMLDKSLYIWSVDATGKIDKSKPYIEIRDESSSNQLGYKGKLKVLVSKGIGSGSSGHTGEWNYSSGAFSKVNGSEPTPTPMKYYSLARSIGGVGPAESDAIELSGRNISTTGCGKTTTSAMPGQPSGGQQLPAATAGRGT